MCRSCTFNHRMLDYPWLEGEVEKLLENRPQTFDLNNGVRTKPGRFSATWYWMENYILLREGIITDPSVLDIKIA